MGKDADSLQKSRKNRSDFIFEYGLVPTSIIAHDKSDKSIDIQASSRSYASSKNRYGQRLNGLGRIMEDQSFRISGQICRGKGKALSRFPQNIGRFLVKFYSNPGETVYDPFSGHNSRMQMVFESGRNYVGVDLSEEFMRDNFTIMEKLLRRNKSGIFKSENTIQLINCSSSSVPEIGSNSCDYTITSPPYWDLEYYGDEPQQLGNSKTFEEFIVNLSNHITENYRILKPGSYCTWFVNDFVKNKIFYCYHMELIRVFLESGFKLHDILIVDLGVPLGACFIETIKSSRRCAKRHEYAITFKKGL